MPCRAGAEGGGRAQWTRVGVAGVLFWVAEPRAPGPREAAPEGGPMKVELRAFEPGAAAEPLSLAERRVQGAHSMPSGGHK